MPDQPLGILKEIKIEFDGRTVTGWYTVSHGMVRVITVASSKTAEIGGMIHFPEGVARILLRELAQEGNA